MNLHEAIERYEAGEALSVLATEMGLDRSVLTREFKQNGARIRLRGGGNHADYFKLGIATPTPKPCIYGCGREVSWGSYACVPCALHPPCTCRDKAMPSGSFYMGKEKCTRCGLLIGGER